MELVTTLALVIWALAYGISVFVDERTIQVIAGISAIIFGILTLVSMV